MSRLLTIITICVSFFYTGISYAVPLVSIIVSPCDYDNKDIFTSGFLGFTNPFGEPNYARLFLSLDDFKYNNFEHSIVVNLPEEIAKERELFNKKFVNIGGKYDCSIVKHGNIGSGGFKNLSQIVVGFENPDFDSNVFLPGAVKTIKKHEVIKYAKNVLKKIDENLNDESKLKSFFRVTEINKNKINRLNWIFSNYLPEKQIQNYSLCKVYEYGNQSGENTTEGLMCYSKENCNFPDHEFAENLPDWTSNNSNLCLEYKVEKKLISLPLEQFN